MTTSYHSRRSGSAGHNQDVVQPGLPAGHADHGHEASWPVKSKTVAAVLAFFLGIFGAHNFYMGWDKEKIKGGLHLLLTILGLVLMLTGFIRELSNTLVDVEGNILARTGDRSGSQMITVGYGIAGAGGIWAFVEFIMILVRQDQRLR